MVIPRRRRRGLAGRAALTLVAAAALAPAAASADPPAAYQANPAHTGVAAGTTFAPPLGKRWVRRDLAGATYPVLAEGKVFLTTRDAVYALDRRTGATVWSRSLAAIGVAYDAGRVFAVDRSGVMQALSAANGQLLWTASLQGSSSSLSPPVAVGEYVYAAGSSTVFGVRQADGIVVWSSSAAASDRSIPAADSDKVYTTSGCAETSALERKLGVQEWDYSGDCTGGGGSTPVVDGGRVYARDGQTGVVLDALTGMLRDSFAAGPPPLIAGDDGYYVQDHALLARSESTGVVRWRHATTEQIPLPPLLAGDHMYAVDSEGQIFALRRQDGQKVWSSRLGVGFFGSNDSAWPGLAAGGDTLVVSAPGRVVAYSPGPDTPGVDDPDKPPANGGAITLKPSSRFTVYRRPVTFSGTMRNRNGGFGGRVEILSDAWPYGGFSHLRYVEADSFGDFRVTVRPDRNTRYRAVFSGTNPGLASPLRQVYSDFREHFRVIGLSRRSVRVRIRIEAAPDLRLAGRRIHVYFYRRHARTALKIGTLRLRRHGRSTQVAAVLRTPALRRSDLFYTCLKEKKDDGFGRFDPRLRTCGRRRMR
jgi:outer membrane protein assembly factor BamB